MERRPPAPHPRPALQAASPAAPSIESPPVPRAGRRPAGALAALVLAALLPLADAAAAERGPQRRGLPAQVQGEEARVLVKFRSGSRAVLAADSAAGSSAERGVLRQAGRLGERVGLTLRDGPMAGARLQVIQARGLSSAALAARLAADSEVEYAVPDGRKRAHAAPSDPAYAGGAAVEPSAGQWYLRSPGSGFTSAIGAEAAWSYSRGSADLVVAVLDTGVRFDHPDLVGKLVPGHDFVTDTTISNDGDGRDGDASDPGDWVTQAESDDASSELFDCGASDSSWHGTQTAGLIAAATNNGVGIAGIGRHVRVQPVRVLGKCIGHDSDILAGLRWAAGIAVPGVPANPHPARVISMSLGSGGSCTPAYQEAIDEARARGAVVVVSAGNDGAAVNAPANCRGVVAVAGLRHIGTKSGYSSLGAEVTLSAPAGNCVNETGACLYPITSTSNSGRTHPACPAYTGSGDDFAVGTSFSAPLVAGTLALMRAAHPGLDPDALAELLRRSARPFPTSGAEAGVPACPGTQPDTGECYCNTATCGAGMLDAGAAVQAAAAGRSVVLIDEGASSRIPLGGSALLSGTASQLADGRHVTGWQWALNDPALARFDGSVVASTARLSALADGNALVTLSLTDSSGARSSSTAVLRTGAAPAASCTPEPDPGNGSGKEDGGGGSFDPASLLAGLLLLGGLLATRRRAPAAGR